MGKKQKDPKRVKAGKSSKLKGANYERKIAKLFEEWFRKYDPECSVARTPQSGGHSKLADDWDMAGDVTCSNEKFIFSIECKCNEAFDLRDLFRIKGPLFTQWWKQCNKACPEGKIPLLVFTKNYHPDFIAMPASKEYGKVLIYSGGANPTVGFHEHKLLPEGMIICLLESILESDPQEWIKLLEARNTTPKPSTNTT